MPVPPVGDDVKFTEPPAQTAVLPADAVTDGLLLTVTLAVVAVAVQLLPSVTVTL